jgi:hypothetical protein
MNWKCCVHQYIVYHTTVFHFICLHCLYSAVSADKSSGGQSNNKELKVMIFTLHHTHTHISTPNTLINLKANRGHHIPTILNGKIYSKAVNKLENCAIT